MSRTSLLIISFSEIRSDARVLKQVREFTRDFDVTTCGYGEQPDGVVEHIRLPDDAPAWRYDKPSVVLRRFRRAYWTNPAVAAAWPRLEGLPNSSQKRGSIASTTRGSQGVVAW